MINFILTFSDSEIKDYFEHSGYRTGTKTLGKWLPVSHGENRWFEYDALVIYMPDGTYVDAREFLQGFASWQFKNKILNDHTSVKKYVENITNPCLRKIT